MNYPKVNVLPKGQASLRRRHPWVFSGALRIGEPITNGTIIELVDMHDQFLAIGYYSHGASIAVRILSFEPVVIGQEFWDRRITQAIDLRRTVALPSSETDAFRLVHAEGDQLPGLVIDIYGTTAVIQCHSIGMHALIDMIAQALKEQQLLPIEAIYDKSAKSLHGGKPVQDNFIHGTADQTVIQEYGHRFHIDLLKGQKTGFFLDQRENRALLGKYATGRSVLNLFAYSGGFSVYALDAGAQNVTSIDVSQNAMDLCEQNIQLTSHPERHTSITADVLVYLKELEDNYDIVIVDPPAFAKSRHKRHKAIQAYKRLNARAISRVTPGGLLFTFSCSQVVTDRIFHDTITAAAIESGRHCQILHILSQGADHPTNIYHPEGKYLKGLVLRVE